MEPNQPQATTSEALPVMPTGDNNPSTRKKTVMSMVVTLGALILLCFAFLRFVDFDAETPLADELHTETIEIPSDKVPSKVSGSIVGPDKNIWFTYYANNKAQIGRIKPDGSFDNITSFTTVSGISTIINGGDGKVWEMDSSVRGREYPSPGESTLRSITPAGEVAVYKLPFGFSTGRAADIHIGSHGDRWVTEVINSRVVYMAPDNKMSLYSIPEGYESASAVMDKDSSLWITAHKANYASKGSIIVKITPAGAATTYKLPTPTTGRVLALVQDGSIWYGAKGKIGRVKPSGEVKDFSILPNNDVGSLVQGPDGNMWFGLAEFRGIAGMLFRIGKVTPDGQISIYNLPKDASASTLLNIPGKGLWNADVKSGKSSSSTISSISMDGKITRHPLSYEFSSQNCSRPFVGPDGNIWYSRQDKAAFCKVTLPQSRS